MLNSIRKVYNESVPLSRRYADVCALHNLEPEVYLERSLSLGLFPSWHRICTNELSILVGYMVVTFQWKR